MQILSYAPGGYRGDIVAVESDSRTGIPGVEIVGLPASEVREARERARVAIRNCGFDFPPRRILINLSPADVHKYGSGFDLAIAVSILMSTGQLNLAGAGRILVVGELHLDGTVGPVRGVLAAAAEAAAAGVEWAVVPSRNLAEARLVEGLRSVGVATLGEIGSVVAQMLCGRSADPAGNAGDDEPRLAHGLQRPDYTDLRGLAEQKRVLEIAAAGGHHVLLVGPPGSGKTMAVSLLPTILTPLSRDEAVEVTRIHSLAGELAPGQALIRTRPFRSPHHQSSAEGLLGGGRTVMPGEAALAHRGVLFLDEALEFRRPVLQGLREPIERGRVSVSRANRRYWYPAAFQLVLATNPCPCGMLGRSDRTCLCSVADVERYWRRLGGPLLDRIDLRVRCRSVAIESLPRTDGSREIAERVARAAVAQTERTPGFRNQQLSYSQIDRASNLSRSGRTLLAQATRAFHLSTRGSLSVIRIARTIADLAGAPAVTDDHLLEAIAYRRFGEDQPLWQ
ncbi:MAG: ATP-binding protein [Spirochaetaceae bacterium]|nr:MAG: ATP-binding protein [Spirochaetaceae bacterium]